jgi:integrase
MARTEKRLTARGVAAAVQPGMYPDGGGLFVAVDLDAKGQSRRRWIWRYRINGKRRDMGLGSPDQISLADVRAERDKWRAALREGRDPIETRRRAKDAGAVKVVTFGDAADAYIAAHESAWRNDKHKAQWRMTLDVYAKPMRDKAVAAIETADVLAVLTPIWTAKPETAARLRGRIEQVIDAARAKGDIPQGASNPARWRAHLDKLLPSREKLSRGHHDAMPYADVPAFVASLRAEESVSARALEFAILTAARTGEVIGARREEVDPDEKVWTVPAGRMKAGKEHRVPLSDRALAIVREAIAAREGPYVFGGRKAGQPISNMAFLMLLRRKKLDVTAHGFRSAFRDWAGDKTTFPREVAEAALAHAVGDETEQAYRRSDALEKRRTLMDAWAGFVGGPGDTIGANVIAMKRGRKRS